MSNVSPNHECVKSIWISNFWNLLLTLLECSSPRHLCLKGCQLHWVQLPMQNSGDNFDFYLSRFKSFVRSGFYFRRASLVVQLVKDRPASALGWPWGMGWGGAFRMGNTCTPMADSLWMYGKICHNIVISLQLK